MPAFNSSTFADFLIGTRETYLKDGKVVNLTGYQKYLLNEFTKGKADSEVIQGGDQIMVNLNTANPSNGDYVNPGETVTRKNFNGLAQLTTGWRFFVDSWIYTRQEVELNKAERVVDLIAQKRKSFRQGMHEHFEADLWATPSTTTMEGVGAQKPYSIPCFITDNGALPSGFSTLMNYAWTNFGNKYGTYTDADDDTLLPAFQTMYRTLNWDPAGVQSDWIDGTKWQKCMIVTNGTGMDKWAKVLRNNQGGNIMVTNNSGDLGVATQMYMYNSVKIHWAPYTDGLGWTYPKFYWINTEYFHPVYHQTVYMDEKDPREFEDRPGTFYVDNTTWWNLVCTNRTRQGVITGA